ncbi:MAG: ArsR family transcriptional regulator [Anaerolineae bacterium]|nr:ArsR family transcriptional regulator [Anaerolineae bacterium]
MDIHLTPDDLAALRFAYSPLVELSTSYRTLYMPHAPAHYLRWIEDVRRALHGVDLPYMTALLSGPRYIPDFLTPTPLTTRHTIEDEIATLAATTPDMLRKNVQVLLDEDTQAHGQTAELRQYFMAYPVESLLCLVDELRLYWRRVLEPHWSRMKTVLDGDILYKARRLAVDGPGGLFSDFHPEITYQPGVIQMEKPYSKAWCIIDIKLDGQGLQLVPSIFAASKIHWQIVPEWHPMLIYTPRGAGLWRQEAPEPDQSLALLLGAGRAQVLQELTTPANTGELARKLSITAGAVSQHLSRLNQAGLVEPHRSGKVVFYHLTPRGQQLLMLFDATN